MVILISMKFVILYQWEFQDPKMGTVAYKAIFGGDIPLHRAYIGLVYSMYLQFGFLKLVIPSGNLLLSYGKWP